MSFEKAKNHLIKKGFEDRVMEFDVSSATVELAAKAVGCEPQEIAKTMSFLLPEDKAILIVTAGDTKIDNQKFKAIFQTKAKMISFEDVGRFIGHEVGGVCPFGINEGVSVYFDESLHRFDYIYPACGSSNSAVRLTCEDLEKAVDDFRWIDVCKLIEN